MRLLVSCEGAGCGDWKVSTTGRLESPPYVNAPEPALSQQPPEKPEA
jgi:hypothetical protein